MIALQFGRRALFFTFTTTNIATALTVAILSQMCPSPSGVVAYAIVILMCLYAFGYSSSWLYVRKVQYIVSSIDVVNFFSYRTLPWVINSEVFPTNVRGGYSTVTDNLVWSCFFSLKV